MRLCFDIETDGIDATRIWCVVAQDVDTKKIYKWGPDDIDLGLNFIKNTATALIGHNIIGYDIAVIKKLTGIDLFSCKLYDTWIMSMVLSYKRKHKHGLAGWGEHLGFSKIDFHDWEKFSDEMMTYCVRDVELNTKVFEVLMDEFKEQAAKKPLIANGLRVEMDNAIFEAQTRMNGWLFDVEGANKLLDKMTAQLDKIESVIHPRLPEMTVMIDKKEKYAKYKKNGEFTATTKRLLEEYLGYTPREDQWEPTKPFQRSYQTQVTLGNMEEVKDYLKQIGWKPDDWNYKKIGYEFIKVSPKLTTTSLIALGSFGRLIDRYYTTRSRRSILEGWLREVKGDRLSGRGWVIGTPTYRWRHEVITNLPSVDAAWGKQMRSLFICEEGFKVVGADSAGNQMRALCHYIGDESFTKEVTSGDIHTYNAGILGCSRGDAKRWLYAYLFGGGGRKLGTILTGKPDDKAGNESKKKYQSAIPGLGRVKTRLDTIYNQTSHGFGEAFIPGLDGRRVYVGSAHQSLNYLLQSAEAITCKAAVSYIMREFDKRGLVGYPVLMYHDEVAWVVREDQAEEAGKLFVEAFTEAPKEFGVMCMGGDYAIGDNYAEVH